MTIPANEFQLLYDTWSSSATGQLRVAGSFTASPSTSSAQLITTAPGVAILTTFASSASLTVSTAPSTSAAQLITTAGTAINVAPSTSNPVFTVSFTLPMLVAPASSAPTFKVDGSGATQPVSGTVAISTNPGATPADVIASVWMCGTLTQ